MTSRNLAWCVAGILLLLCIQPALGSPDAVSYEDKVTLIHDQDGEGGCIGLSMTHVLEILKEMEAPYTPDPSYAFLNYVFYASTAGGTDPRVPGDSAMNGWPILSTLGLPPETSFPTNFDHIGNKIPDVLAHPPPDTAFNDALPYRVQPGVAYLNNPTTAQAEDWLATRGPVICKSLFPAHTVALIGYDRSVQEFTIVDSANWLNIGHAGVKKVSYAYFASKQPDMSLESVTNGPTPLVHPYTARIRISHEIRRAFLTVKIGVAGHDFVTVWDGNNYDYYDDYGKDLAIDVPLPDYAAEHWPPSATNRWVVQVTNHANSTNAVLNEVTLVKRTANPSPYPVSVSAYKHEDLRCDIHAGGSVDISFPRSITVTSPIDGGATWTGGETRTITWSEVGLEETNVRIELRKGAAGTLASTIAYSTPARTGFQSGSFEWQLPANLVPGSDYFIHLETLTGPHIRDRSDGPLTILSPEASFWCAPKAGYAPLTVYFHDTSDGDPFYTSWDFGDGSPIVHEQNPSHTYAAAGTYTVGLSVLYPGGGSSWVTKTAEIEVGALTDGLIWVEAEDYNEGGEGVAYHDTTPGNSGGGYRPDEDVDIVQGRTLYVVTDVASGEWTRYQVVSGAAGMYDYPLQLRVASFPVKRIPRTITVNVSGIEGVVEVVLPITGSDTLYAYANATLRLKPGMNTVQFTYHGNATNFDYFTLDPSGVGPWPTITPPPIEVHVVPGAIGPPTSTTIPGLFDDINGNSRKDFADVVLYFNQMSWIGMNEPVEGFDYNLNRRIDFADVVWLFNNL